MPSSGSLSGSLSGDTPWDIPSLRGSEAKLLLVFLGTPAATLGPRVSIEQLAGWAGLSWRSAQAALKRLEARGLLVRELHGKDGTRYHWPPPVSEPANESAPELASTLSASEEAAPEPLAAVGVPGGEAGEPVLAAGPALSLEERFAQSKWLKRFCPPATVEDVRRWCEIAGSCERLVRCLQWMTEEKQTVGYETVEQLTSVLVHACYVAPLAEAVMDPLGVLSEFQRWEKAQEQTKPH